MSVFATMLISVAVIFVTALLFIGWVAFTILRTVFHAVLPSGPKRMVRRLQERFNPLPGQLRCVRENCQNMNPPGALFCRCCGTNLQTTKSWQPYQLLRRPGRIGLLRNRP